MIYKKRNYFRIHVPLVIQIIWIFSFCYSVISSIFFQTIVIPLIPGMQSSKGIINGDAAVFHRLAIQMVESNNFGLNFEHAGSLNVLILGILYKFLGVNPLLVIPVNSILLATSTVIFYKLANKIYPIYIARKAGAISIAYCVIIPSILIWNAQPHKDPYAFLSWALLFYSLTSFMQSFKPKYIVYFGLATTLFYLVRPQYLHLWVISSLLLVSSLAFFKLALKGKICLLFLILSSLFLALKIPYNLKLPGEMNSNSNVISLNTPDPLTMQHCKSWEWKRNLDIPLTVESMLYKLALLRSNMICEGSNAATTVDLDFLPQSSKDVLSLIPSALMMTLFYPTPKFLISQMSIVKGITLLEMLFWYFALSGLLFVLSIRYKRSAQISILFTCFFCMTILGIVSPNVGTIYRIRYPFQIIILLIGISGWVYVLENTFKFRKKKVIDEIKSRIDFSNHFVSNIDSQEGTSSRKEVKQATMLVTITTLITYLLFFIRDILVARRLGAGAQLDALYSALMIPTFLVAILSQPLGQAITPIFLQKSEHDLRGFIKKVSAFVILVSIGFSLLIFGINASMLKGLFHLAPQDVLAFLSYFRLAILIFFFSGLTIVGNAVLNSIGKATISSASQIIAPLTTVIVILLLGKEVSVAEIVVGIILGQVFNLVLIVWFCFKNGLSLYPKHFDLSFVKVFLSSYINLTISSILTAILLPISQIFAISLAVGSVGIFTIGNKLTIFLTSLSAMSMNFVLLPYFSKLFSSQKDKTAKNELLSFLLNGNYFSFILSLLIFLLAPFLVQIVLQGGSFSSDSSVIVANIMKVGTVQLPFFITLFLIQKYCTALNRSGLVLSSTFVSTFISIFLSYFLMGKLDVIGIICGITVGTIAGAVFSMIMLLFWGHINIINFIHICLCWSLFLTAAISLHVNNYLGLFFTICIFSLLLKSRLNTHSTEEVLVE